MSLALAVYKREQHVESINMVEKIASIPLHTEGMIDDCWNRIGIRGDRSCAKLKQHIHCHNCEIYAAAAKRILDLYPVQARDSVADERIESLFNHETTTSILVFRLGDEWLALPLNVLVEVAPVQTIHSLPHRRSETVLGISNVRGSLAACLSLAHVLGLDATTTTTTGIRVTPRMLIIGHAGEGNVVCPVDEVDGIHDVPISLLVSHSESKYTRALFQWQGHSVCLLDEHALLHAIKRSLA